LWNAALQAATECHALAFNGWGRLLRLKSELTLKLSLNAGVEIRHELSRSRQATGRSRRSSAKLRCKHALQFCFYLIFE
jgi:hypothetical protein